MEIQAYLWEEMFLFLEIDLNWETVRLEGISIQICWKVFPSSAWLLNKSLMEAIHAWNLDDIR